MRNRIINFILSLGFAVVAGIFAYPSFTNALNNIFQIATIGNYSDDMDQFTDEEIEKMKADAEAYNQKVYQQQQERTFVYMGEHATDDEYESVLCLDPVESIMGYVDIPTADVYLPIAHGTKTPQLKYEAGHIYGSSVPWAGENVRSVIAGHTGLQGAEIFTHLTDVKMGDKFYLHILDKIFVYKVDDIQVVWPEDEAPYLQIEEGRDLATLYTCTPYGINDHRLIITGEHIDTQDANTDGQASELKSRNKKALAEAIALACLPVLVLIAGLIISNRRKKKGEKK